MEDRIKLFALSSQMLNRDLDLVEKKYNIDLERKHRIANDKDEIYYPQFSQSVRDEAREMSKHYELFYCLEKSIRTLVASRLESEKGTSWWDTCVPPAVKENVIKNLKKEEESGFTIRSVAGIDYTTFGELGDIVRHNWSVFSDTFNNQSAFNKIMASLNVLRAPIAHCCPLAEDEVLRLRLTVRDWYRLME